MHPQLRLLSRRRLLGVPLVLLSGCARTPPQGGQEITVAAAANLTGVFDEVGKAFTGETGIRAVFSYGSTAQLAQQISNAAPFDVFAAADLEHIDSLISSGRITHESRAVYARGVLALWVPDADSLGIQKLDDLSKQSIRSVAIASPEAAPYGKAAVEALRNAKLWDALRPKVVYSGNINMAKQFAASGNADAAFTAWSLVFKDKGLVLRVDTSLYSPIEQAIGVVSSSSKPNEARRFIAFLTGPRGRSLMEKSGYTIPG